MKRTEYQVPGETCVNRNGSSLKVANLTNHDDVRRLSKDGSQRCRERHPDVFLHLDLINTGKQVFDRILNRDDFSV